MKAIRKNNRYVAHTNGKVSFSEIQSILTMKNSVAIQFETGSSDDPEGKEGLAHMTEHVITHSKNPMKEHVAREKDGISCYAYTYKERTTYFASSYMLPVEKVVAVLIDLLSNEITKEAFEQEYETVCSEMEERKGDAAKLAYDGAMRESARTIDSAKRYGHPVIGTKEGLKNIKFSDITEFIEGRYKNPMIAITSSKSLSKKESDKILKMISSSNLRFKRDDISTGRKEISAEENQGSNLTGTRFRFDIKNTQIKGFCVAGAERTREALYLGLIKQYLAGNWSSVFNRKMRSENQLAYFAYGSIEAFTDFGCVYVTYEVLPDKKGAADDIAEKIFEDLKSGKIDEDAFIAAKKMRMTEMLATFSNEEDLLDDFLYSNRNPWNSAFYTLEQYIEEIEKMILKEFTDYIGRIFRKNIE